MSFTPQAATPAPAPHLFTRREAAAYLSISQRKLDALAASQKIKRVKIDSCVRFDRGDLDAFVESRKSA
jgi:excisionase family DNA binding protein